MAPDVKKRVEKRLSRAAGQVAGIQKMVADDRYCIDVVMQISAARAALARASQEVLAQHFETCLAEAFESGDEGERRRKIEELIEVFARHGKS